MLLIGIVIYLLVYNSFESSYKMNSNRDEDMLEALVQHIKYERENDISVLKSSPFNQIISKEESEVDVVYSSQAKQTIPLYARGMNIFDMNLHLVSFSLKLYCWLYHF